MALLVDTIVPVNVVAFTELARLMPPSRVADSFEAYCVATGKVAEAMRALSAGSSSCGVSEGAVPSTLEGSVSVNSSASSARARRRARARAVKRAQQGPSSSLTYTGQGDRVTEEADGYCYLAAVKEECLAVAATQLGSYPTFQSLLGSPAVWFDCGHTSVSRTTTGLYHVGDTGMVPLTKCLISVLLSSPGYVAQEGTLASEIAKMGLQVEQGLVSKAPALADRCAGRLGAGMACAVCKEAASLVYSGESRFVYFPAGEITSGTSSHLLGTPEGGVLAHYGSDGLFLGFAPAYGKGYSFSKALRGATRCEHGSLAARCCQPVGTVSLLRSGTRELESCYKGCGKSFRVWNPLELAQVVREAWRVLWETVATKHG